MKLAVHGRAKQVNHKQALIEATGHVGVLLVQAPALGFLVGRSAARGQGQAGQLLVAGPPPGGLVG